MLANLCRLKRSFKPYQNEHDLVKENREKGNKPFNIDLKISTKILFQSTGLPFLSSEPKILKAFPKTFPTKMKPTKSPTKEKKMKMRGEEKAKR